MVGKVTTEGDRALRSNIARQRFQVDGSGITIAVISDSFNAYDGASADILSGDLPGRKNPNGYRQSVRSLKDELNFKRVSDEGRAMLQIIHDVAPGARLLFHTSGDTEADFSKAVRALSRAGADIIVDDIGFPTSAVFQDGIAAQAVTAVVDQGIAYFSAAGNDGDRSYESPFRPGTQFIYRGSTYEAQDFDMGEGIDVFQSIKIPKRFAKDQRAINLIFSWDQSVGQVTNDVELFLLKNPQLPGAGGQGVEAAEIITTGFDSPSKQLFYQPKEAETVYLVIARRVNAGGTAPGLVKWLSFANGGDGTVKYEYVNEGQGAIGGSTIFGQPNAKGAIAVGAVDAQNTPAFGVNLPVPQTYSSIGKTPILFDAQGNRLAVPEVRQKPEIFAPDGVVTTVDDPFTVGIDFSPFSGTSAAAPHAAAVAALILQRAGGRKSLTPNQILGLLQTTAIATSTNASAFIQADKALLQLAAMQKIGTSAPDQLRGTKTADNLWGLAGDDQIRGASGFDAIAGGPGNDQLSGGDGNDSLLGQSGSDQLLGGKGNDWLKGGGGRDTLSGGKGDNVLQGGAGRDRFELSRQGLAIIKDFKVGSDRLQLPQGITFEDLDITQQGRTSLVQTSNHLLAKLNDIQASTLQAQDVVTFDASK